MITSLAFLVTLSQFWNFHISDTGRIALIQRAQGLGLSAETIAVAGCTVTDACNILAALEQVPTDLDNIHRLEVAVDQATDAVGAARSDSDSTGNGFLGQALTALAQAEASLANAKTALLATATDSLDSTKKISLKTAIANRARGLPREWIVLNWSPEELAALESAIIANAAASRNAQTSPAEVQTVVQRANEQQSVIVAQSGLSQISAIQSGIDAWAASNQP